MSYEITGRLIRIFDAETKGTFTSRDFVIEVVDGNYTQVIKLQLVQDKCSLIDHFLEGQEIKAHFNIRGKEWQGKYFTNLQAWKIE